MKTNVLENTQAGRTVLQRKTLVALSPVIIVLLGFLAAQVSIKSLGVWAWVGTLPVYWGMMLAVIMAFGTRSQLAGWFAPSRGGWVWPALALLVGLSPFPMLLLPNLSFMRPLVLVVLWLLFALINGVVEELYWRGFLLNELRGWPAWGSVTYTSGLFISIHFLMLGTLTPAMFNLPFLGILTAITVGLVTLYLRTGSLRWPVVAHILADLGNLNIFVFMNLIQMAF